MKILKKVALVISIFLFLIIGAAIALPLIFKEDLIAAVKSQVNENLNARVEFSDVSLSLFRNFPNVNFRLENLTVTGVDEFDKIELISTDAFDLVLDFWSVISGGNPLKISRVHLQNPNLKIVVLKNGKANYDIMKQAPTGEQPESATNLKVELEQYSISNGHIIYDDLSTDFYTELKGVEHSGSGNFTVEIFDLITGTEVEQLTAIYGGVKYLSKVNTKLDATILVDMKQMKFTLKENDLFLNALNIKANGWFAMPDGAGYDMDFIFKAPSNQFKDLLSLIPGAYIREYDQVKANGHFAFEATVKGKYLADTNSQPEVKLKLQIENGDVRYPDLPVGITDINAQVNLHSPSADYDQTTVRIPRFALRIGNNPFEGHFNLKTPLSNPDVDTRLKGTIDLAELAKAFPVEGTEQLNGIIYSDMELKAKMSDMESGNYDNVQAKGQLDITKMVYDAADMPPVKIHQLKLNLSPKVLAINNFDANLGKSDLRANGTVEQYLAYFSPEKTMKGTLTVRSNQFDVNEWMSTDTSQIAVVESAEPQQKVFDRFDFNFDGQFDIIQFQEYKLFHTIAKGNLKPNQLNISSFSTKIGKSDIAASGEVNNIFDYLFENQTLSGDIQLKSDLIDLNEFMSPASATATTVEATEPILVPEKVDMKVDASVNRLLYSNLDLQNVQGKVLIKDEQVRLQNVTTEVLGGKMSITGGYNTQDPEKPKFDLDYGLQSIGFQDAFNTFNTFQKLAPIGKFLSGKFNTSMAMTGVLTKDLTPDLNTLNLEGILETLNGVLSGFKPLEKAGDLLTIKEFKNIDLKNLKTKFEVKEGRVAVEEFPVDWQNIKATVAGSHSINQQMEYLLKAQIPRSLLEKSKLTASANTGLNLLGKEAGKLGINLDAGEFVNVGIQLQGTITDPKVSIKLLGTDGKPLNVAETVKEEVTEAIQEKVEEVKTEVKEEIDKQKEELRKKADAEIQAVLKNAESTAQKIREEGRRLAQEAKNAGYTQAEKLEKEAGNNPLKKTGAKLAADKLRKESDTKSEQIIREADKKADEAMTKANQEAGKIREKYGIDSN